MTLVGCIARPRAAAYASKAGDTIRSGRARDVGPSPVIALAFHDCTSHVDARLGVVTVGTITPDMTSTGGYFWAVFLPGMPRTPRPARDLTKARDAIEHRVREWCEAARLMSVRR